MAGRRRQPPKTSSRQMRQMVVNMINARRELKANEYTSAGNMPENGALATPTQGIVQGDSNITRDGNAINVKELRVRFELFLDPAAVIDFCRLIVFSDNQSNGVYPTVADVLNTTDPNSAYTNIVTVIKRFKILSDRTFPMSINGNSRAIQHVETIKLGNHVVNYQGTTDVQGSNGKGAIYAIIIADLAANFTAYNLSVQTLYYDS